MKARGISRYLGFGAATTGLGLLLLVVAQLNALEKRFSTQNQQLRQLGENTERLASEMKRLQSGASAAAPATDGCRIDRVLHPEVPNFLKPMDTHWPAPGAALNGTLKRALVSGDPKGFNWMLENSTDVQDLTKYTDQALAARNSHTDPSQWHGELACRVEITDDFKEYTIYLRRDALWHHPAAADLNDPKHAWLKGEHPVTAHDFVFTLDMIMNPQVENGFIKNSYADLESFKAVDDYTLVIRWKRKVHGSLSASLDLNALPEFLYAFSEEGERYPKEVLGTKLNRHWYNSKGMVGAGPYTFDSYVPGTSLSFSRNPAFTGQKPAIEKIQYAIYTDGSQTPLRMKAREVNFAYLQPGIYRQEVQQWQTRPKAEWPKDSPFLNGQIECQRIPYPAFSYIGWNRARPMFTDPRVRTAMTLALRRREILEKVYSGLGELTTGPFLPETGYLDPNVDPLEFDLKRAQALLTESGWIDDDGDGVRSKLINGKAIPFEFSLLIPASRPEAAAAANIFKDDLLSIGVRLKLEAAEWSLSQKRTDERDYDAYLGAWAPTFDSDPFQLWHSSQADVPKGSNHIGFRSPEADKLLEELRVTFDPAKRTEMMRHLHRLIYADQAYTFFLRRKFPYCWHSEVRDVSFAKERPIDDTLPWSVSEAQ